MRVSMKLSFLMRSMASIGALFAFSAHAEYGCQSGFVPVYQGNRQVCVADYNLPVWQQQGQQQQQPAEIWEDRYGATAVIRGTSNYFVSTDMNSKESAEADALKKCGTNCEIIGNFRNSCISVTWNGETNLFRAGGDKKSSDKKAVAACGRSAKTCELIFSACSLPVRVQ